MSNLCDYCGIGVFAHFTPHLDIKWWCDECYSKYKKGELTMTKPRVSHKIINGEYGKDTSQSIAKYANLGDEVVFILINPNYDVKGYIEAITRENVTIDLIDIDERVVTPWKDVKEIIKEEIY